MVSRREALQEALRLWRAAERELVADGHDAVSLDRKVVRLRDDYQRIYTMSMMENLERLQDAEDRRSASIPSTPAFHEATQDTEMVAADIWEQARRCS